MKGLNYLTSYIRASFSRREPNNWQDIVLIPPRDDMYVTNRSEPNVDENMREKIKIDTFEWGDVAKWIKEMGLCRKEFAHAVGVGDSTLYLIMVGQNPGRPTLSMLQQMRSDLDLFKKKVNSNRRDIKMQTYQRIMTWIEKQC